jgi:hypothetical protein
VEAVAVVFFQFWLTGKIASVPSARYPNIHLENCAWPVPGLFFRITLFALWATFLQIFVCSVDAIRLAR